MKLLLLCSTYEYVNNHHRVAAVFTNKVYLNLIPDELSFSLLRSRRAVTLLQVKLINLLTSYPFNDQLTVVRLLMRSYFLSVAHWFLLRI